MRADPVDSLFFSVQSFHEAKSWAAMADLFLPSSHGLSLRLEAGRASYGSDEFFCLGNGAKRVLLDRHIAADFMEALRRMNRHVRKGILLDKVFFNFDITDFDGVVLGIELGIKTGRPYIGLEAARVCLP